MALDAVNRFRVLAQVMRNWPGSLGGVTKTQLRDAVDATDDWIEANQTSFNAALPQPFRGSANLAQKTFLLCYVAMRRAGLLRTPED
jgi:hypothetical protein